MLIEQGTVVAVDHDGLWVETLKQSACAQCSARAGCGQRLLNAAGATSKMSKIKAYFRADSLSCGQQVWVVGNQVEIGIEEDALVLATLITYMVPLVAMVFFAYLASRVSVSDLVTVSGAIVGLLLGALYARWHAYKNKSNCRYHAVVLGSGPIPS